MKHFRMVSKSDRNWSCLHRGFTVIETTIAAGVLVFGLVTIASLFTSSIDANRTNRLRTTATLLLIDKMDQMRVTPLDRPEWIAGGGLSADSPIDGYSDFPSGADGDTYVRLWQIDGTSPRTVTVVVCANRTLLNRHRMELVRATTLVTPTF